MSDKLSEIMWVDPKERMSGNRDTDAEHKSRLISAFKKALDNTTPESAGTPWDNEVEIGSNNERGYIIPSGD